MKPQEAPISVLLDARKIGDGGIGVYIENLVNGLLSLPTRQRSRFSLALLTTPLDSAKLTESTRADLLRLIESWADELTIIPEPAGKYSIEEYLLLASRQRNQLYGTDIFHSPHYTLPYFLKIPAIVTIHDIIHVTHPDSKLHALVGRRLIGSALKRAQHVITVSKASRDRIMENFPQTTVPMTVIPNGLRSGIEQRTEADVENFCAENFFIRPYCLFVGSDRPHKGFAMLCQAWSLLQNYCRREEKQMPILVAVGSRFSSQTRAVVYEHGLGQVVRFVEDISNSTLSLLYSGADALLIPSLEEGFGMMAVEAMACRTRVVATPVPSVKEICGRSGYYSDDYSAGSFYLALKRCLEDKRWERKAIDGLCRVKKFSTQEAADKTLKVYLKIVRERREGISIPLVSQLEGSIIAAKQENLDKQSANNTDEVLEVFNRE
ncbi:MAG: glycosyltransferase family 4 protein [Deltaproteobacteria bacterium]|nr:glycosyltransferase family 4 protein [Deltaproteobacteria bacterium]